MQSMCVDAEIQSPALESSSLVANMTQQTLPNQQLALKLINLKTVTKSATPLQPKTIRCKSRKVFSQTNLTEYLLCFELISTSLL